MLEGSGPGEIFDFDGAPMRMLENMQGCGPVQGACFG